jgi:hypothetical protein
MPTLADLLPRGSGGIMPSVMGALPTPARLYLESIVGGKRGPITEQDFTPEELGAIRRMVDQQKESQGGIDYGAYQDRDQPGLSSLGSPAGRVANSLGQFTYQRDPEGTTVSDNYDFNPMYSEQPALIKALSMLSTLGWSGAHMLGESVLPPGSGRPVSIRFPNR